MLYQSAPHAGNESLPIELDSSMLVWITSSLLCAVFVDYLQGKSSRDRRTTGDEPMTKKQSTGLVFMLGSAAAAIQLTIFSPVLRGWLYSVCLGVLIVVFASGADLFRGNE